MSDQTEDRLNEIDYKLDSLQKSNEKILDCLKGNGMNPKEKGLIGDMEKAAIKISLLEDRIDALEKLKDKFIYLALGAGAALGWSITDLIGKIFSKH